MNRFLNGVLLIAALPTITASPNTFAAKPGAGGGDTRAPGGLTGLQVVPGIRGLGLTFVATGDDGTSGTATAYETRIEPGQDCASIAWSTAWTSAPHSVPPRPAGSADGIHLSPLAANTAYCIQIRARDDVGLYSPSATIAGTTLTGAWHLTAVPTTGNTNLDTVFDASNDTVLMAARDRADSVATGVKVMRVLPADSAGIGSSSFDYDKELPAEVESPSADDCLLTTQDCVVAIPLGGALFGGKLDAIDTSTSVAIALDNQHGTIGVLVVGTLAGAPSAALLERRADGWHSQKVTRPAEAYNHLLSTGLVYVAGNPIYTWVRVDSADARTLMLSERIAGTWTDTPLLSRSRASCTRKSCPQLPVFNRFVFRDYEGRLKVWVAPDNSNGGVNGAYLVRRLASDTEYGVAGCTSPWTHYFSARLESGGYYNAALDQAGHLITAAHPSVSGVQLLLAREGVANQLSVARCGATPVNGNTRDASLLWANVASDIPASWQNGRTSEGPQGLSDSSCGVQVGLSIWLAGAVKEAQLLNVEGTDAHTQRVDHPLWPPGRDVLQTMADDGQVLAYYNVDRARRRHFVLARGPASCAP